MNDFDYDVMQKKRLAHNKFRNAKYKHGGCRLPHEDLTPAQIKRRNGPMMTYNLNLPMSWKDFKSMPHDLQQQYLDNLHARFGVGPGDIAKHLFLRDQGSLYRSTKDMGLTVAKRDKNRDFDGFLAWIRKEEDATDAPSEDAKDALLRAEASAKTHGCSTVEQMTFTLTGDNLTALVLGLPTHLAPYLTDGRPVRVTLNVSFGKEG